MHRSTHAQSQVNPPAGELTVCRDVGDDERAECRGLYNWRVMKLRAGERWNWKAAKKPLAESREFAPSIDQVYGKRLSEVYFRLDRAMQAFFKRVAAGSRPRKASCH